MLRHLFIGAGLAACVAGFSAEPAHLIGRDGRSATTLRRQHEQQPAWQPTLQALGSLFVAPAAAALVGGACLFGGADGALAAELTADQELVAQA